MRPDGTGRQYGYGATPGIGPFGSARPAQPSGYPSFANYTGQKQQQSQSPAYQYGHNTPFLNTTRQQGQQTPSPVQNSQFGGPIVSASAPPSPQLPATGGQLPSGNPPTPYTQTSPQPGQGYQSQQAPYTSGGGYVGGSPLLGAMFGAGANPGNYEYNPAGEQLTPNSFNWNQSAKDNLNKWGTVGGQMTRQQGANESSNDYNKIKEMNALMGQYNGNPPGELMQQLDAKYRALDAPAHAAGEAQSQALSDLHRRLADQQRAKIALTPIQQYIRNRGAGGADVVGPFQSPQTWAGAWQPGDARAPYVAPPVRMDPVSIALRSVGQ